jgi:hypothetical protein
MDKPCTIVQGQELIECHKPFDIHLPCATKVRGSARIESFRGVRKLSIYNAMKHSLVLGFILIFTTLSVFAGPERMLGTWKSNKGATVAHLKIHTSLTKRQIEKLSTVLGKMLIVIDAETITLKQDDWTFTSKYKVLSEVKNTITFEAQDPQTKKLVKSVFEFDGSGKGFWTGEEKIPGYKERFDKVVVQ